MNKSELIQAKICDFFELKQGFAFPSKHFSKDGDLLVIKIKNIKSRGLDLSKKEFVSIEYSQTHKEFIPVDGDLLVSLSGNRYEGGIETWAGKVSHYSGTPFCIINQRVGILRKRKNTNIDTRYFSYLLSTIEEQKKLILIANSSGGQANLSKEQILTHKVNIHSFPEQKAIAHILGTLDKKIIINKKINENLEDIAKALFKSWFIDFDPVRAKEEGRSTGLANEISDLFPESFKDSELGQIPKHWDIKSLDEIAIFLNGLALQKYPSKGNSNDLPVIKIAQLRKGNSKDSDKCSSNIDEKYIIRDGDILFSWSGSLLVDIWTGGLGALNQHLFKVSSDIYKKWFILYWTKHHLQEFQMIAQSKATTLGHIQRKHLSEAKVLVPPANLMTKITSIFEDLLERQINARLESKILLQIQETILPQLISGELRITDAEKIIEESGI